MPNKRQEGKKLIGAQATPELCVAIDTWIAKHPRENRSSFLLLAAVEKLQRDGIPIDIDQALRDGRTRPVAKSPQVAAVETAQGVYKNMLKADLKAIKAAGSPKHGTQNTEAAHRAPHD